MKGQTANKLFGKGGDSGIYVNSLLPTPIYKLGAASRERARTLHYPDPIVRFNCVFMRRTLKGLLITITFADDLDHLLANQPTATK